MEMGTLEILRLQQEAHDCSEQGWVLVKKKERRKNVKKKTV